MKKNKLKIITIILLIILLTMVGFFGVYSKYQNTTKNGVKDYQYAMDLDGKRVVTLKLDTNTSEVIKDSEGNKVESATDEEIEQKGYTKSEEPANSEESKTVENYRLTKEIIEKRLNKLNVPSYAVRLNEKTGEIIVELPENENTDNWVSNLTTVGKLEIIDTETKEVLLNNDDIQTSEVLRSTTSSGTSIYFSIEFNGEGKKKLEDITKTYVPASKATQETETSETDAATEETAETEEAAKTEETENATEKTITMKLDDTDVMSTSFEEPITDGKMHLTVGQASTDTKKLNENLQQARNMATLLSNKNLPLKYTEEGNIFVQSTLKDNVTKIMLIGIGCLIILVVLVLLIKYKGKGILAGISFIGFSALLLLMIRYWNVVLSTEGIVALFAMLILNYILTNKILKNIVKEEDNKKIESKKIINMQIIDFVLKTIPLFIVGVVFTFMQWSSTSSFGMVTFWGLTLIVLYNLLITKNLLKYKKQM